MWFWSKHSTNHALKTEHIKNSLDLVGDIFIDLEKACDTANHDIVCNTLPSYGFRGKTKLLIQ